MRRLNLRKKHIRSLKFILLAVLFLFVTPSLILAHRVFLSAYVEGDAIFVEAGFSDGTLCKNSTIEVFDPSGNKLLVGKTNENGEFSFHPPQKTDLKIVLDAGMGHMDEYTVPADELPDMTGDQVTGTEALPARNAETPGDSQAVARIDPKEIEAIVDGVVQKRLRPLTRLVAKSQRKTGFSLTEVFGGIGYMLGFMGIAMHFRYRKGSKFEHGGYGHKSGQNVE